MKKNGFLSKKIIEKKTAELIGNQKTRLKSSRLKKHFTIKFKYHQWISRAVSLVDSEDRRKKGQCLIAQGLA